MCARLLFVAAWWYNTICPFRPYKSIDASRLRRPPSAPLGGLSVHLVDLPVLFVFVSSFAGWGWLVAGASR